MGKIIIKNLENRIIESNDESKTILENILESGQDWMHACGGNGRCTTCAFNLVEVDGSISEESEAEKKFRDLGKITDSQRLACQSHWQGTLTVRVPERNKLPHLSYSE
jgi:2Fe-2S ferredoxin